MSQSESLLVYWYGYYYYSGRQRGIQMFWIRDSDAAATVSIPPGRRLQLFGPRACT